MVLKMVREMEKLRILLLDGKTRKDMGGILSETRPLGRLDRGGFISTVRSGAFRTIPQCE